MPITGMEYDNNLCQVNETLEKIEETIKIPVVNVGQKPNIAEVTN